MSSSEEKSGRDRRQPDLNTVYTINEDGSRNMLQVADVKGRWTTRKYLMYAALILVYLAGATFTTQDFHLFFFVLIVSGVGLFVLTSVFGREWCGFACPQTVFMEGVFRPI